MRTPVRATSWLAPQPPTVAIEIASHRVTVAALAPSGSPVLITHQASETLPDGAVQPAAAGVNIPALEPVAESLRRALDRAGLGHARRAALVVPDSIARVSLLLLEAVPPKPSDLDRLVHWQISKSIPFPIAEAQISHFVANTDKAITTIAAVVARRDVVAQYEAVVRAVGVHPGLVDLASLNVMNGVIGAGGAADDDWLLVHLASESTTLAILRRDQLMFYRHRHRAAVDEEPLRALVHQTAMYHEDRLGGSRFARVWLCGVGSGAEDARRQISGRLGVPVQSVDVRPAIGGTDRLTASPEALDALAAPVGILIRERTAA
jgi:type IV pilus assembly protein PilM